MAHMQKPKRRWVQFGMRSVLLATLIVALLFGLGRTLIDPYFAQQQALGILKNHQVAVETKYTLPKRWSWIAKIDPQGADRYREVTFLNMTGGDYSKRYLNHLATMRCLEALVVRGKVFDETDLRRLVQLENLRLIILDSTSVSPETAETIQAEWTRGKIRISQRELFERAVFHRQAMLARTTGMKRRAWSYVPFELDDNRGNGYSASSSDDLMYWMDQGAGFNTGAEHWLDVERIMFQSPDDTDLDELQVAHTARQLSISSSRITAQGMKQLGALRNLADLTFQYPEVKPDLQVIAQLTSLQRLKLLSGSVTDESLQHLATLTQLKNLDLSLNAIDGTGFGYLQDLPLERVVLSKTKLSEEGVAQLAKIDSLIELDLADTRIGSAAVAHLARLPRLRKLSLRNTRIDDEAMQHIAHLVTLESLSLQNTNITDAELLRLETLTQLRHLDLSVTDLTDERVTELLESLPLQQVTR